ncbi:MAG: DUF4965 domain-containing protein [Rikenellaceae bacterium]|jgi:hypothetical protein|nr:DUF4965 domain-containing protein [Rikenellaceae bacterium]
MKKLFLCFPLLCLAACCSNKAGKVIKNELRPPAYPLITIDPYTSAWSMTDNLYDGPVKHWTGKDFPLTGAIRVDGEVYRFMGVEEVDLVTVVPSSQQGEWYGRYTTTEPGAGWTAPGFNDAAWKRDRAAFGTKINEPTAKTDWTTEHIWVRREVVLDEDLAGRKLWLEYSNDDDAVFYINGTEILSTGAMCNKDATVRIPDDVAKTLVKGRNVIAAKCWNSGGNALLDFGIVQQKELHTILEKTAVQKSVDVQATQTHYLFACGGVDLALSFSAPLFMDDLTVLSRPVNYLTYRVSSNDRKEHDVQLYFEASPRWALDQPWQESVTESLEDGDLLILRSGSREQNILAKNGDDRRIDWGYFYMAAAKEQSEINVGNSDALQKAFVGNAPCDKATKGENADGKMALTRALGTVNTADGMIMIGYDDIYSIQYFGNNLRPYWNSEGNRTIIDELHDAHREHGRLIEKCYRFDRELMLEATEAGGKKYAELCALAYRQAIAAHKLVKSPDGELLWFSKENNSNGSIGTVDITYPSAPLFLRYSTELAKGLLNHIFHYSESGRWTKPFPAHDVGTYPLANGQTYGGDMPVEEAGNMLTITAAVCIKENDASYAEKHWATLSTWANYLLEHGLDPENQLCTDDFAGRFAHNTNLSVKAIVGIASFGRLAGMLGKEEQAQTYGEKAREMAAKWIEMADDGDHYRLTFDKGGTWSQKYNLVWDKLLDLGLFPQETLRKEIAYYSGVQNRYGLPLDNRATYTKTDWIVWTATLADDRATFESFIGPMWLFMNETVDRVPMSDWVFTDKPSHRGFKARSVVGGYFIKMLENAK